MTMEATRTDTPMKAEPEHQWKAWGLVSRTEIGSSHSPEMAWPSGSMFGAARSDDETSNSSYLESAVERWLTNYTPSAVTTTSETDPRTFGFGEEWLAANNIAEAKRRFKDALEDAEEEEIPTPSDSVLLNALRAVQMIDDHCPQGLSSVAVSETGIEATARGSNRNYISVECEESGEVLVMFNVRSYARYEDMDAAERNGFLKNLLGTLRY